MKLSRLARPYRAHGIPWREGVLPVSDPRPRTAVRRRPVTTFASRIGASRWRLHSALVAALAMAAVGAVTEPAYAESYPSWQDVQNAKSSEAAAAGQVSRITTFIAELKTSVAQAQAEEARRGTELEKAQAKFDDADIRARDIQQQADASKKKADAATTQAGRLAAQLYRSGGSNLTVNIFLDGSNAGGSSTPAAHRGASGGATGVAAKDPSRLLATLGSMTKLVEHSSDVYQQAATAKNLSRTLADQAAVARGEREKLRTAAAEALATAATAAKAAQDRLAAQQAQIGVLQAQLAALEDTTAKTVSAYQKGVEERAKQAAAAGAGGLPGGWVGPQGWAVPVHGAITDGFGARSSPCADCSDYHLGIDLGAACDSPIYAAYSGTVVYAARLGTYGNFVLLDNGSGINTGYAHIRDGGTLVGYGQHVGAGEPIARVGTTGASTGCHLHYEVRTNDTKIDGIPFMKGKGAPLG